MPTTSNAEVIFGIQTDIYPGETSFSLVDNSEDGTIVHLGPGDGGSYDVRSSYTFTWTLNRCTSYTFTIYDSYGDGFGISAYDELKVEEREVIDTLGKIKGNFGSESSITFINSNGKSDN
jgi:hypothetical protein